jgi:hypothetical protein
MAQIWVDIAAADGVNCLRVFDIDAEGKPAGGIVRENGKGLRKHLTAGVDSIVWRAPPNVILVITFQVSPFTGTAQMITGIQNANETQATGGPVPRSASPVRYKYSILLISNGQLVSEDQQIIIDPVNPGTRGPYSGS